MKTRISLIAIALITSFSLCSAQQRIINIGIGPVWPHELHGTEKPTAWNATVEGGYLFDNIIGLGLDFDFMWNRVSEDTSYLLISPGATLSVNKKIYQKIQFMFPISLALFIDPIPKFRLHPVLKGQFGLNMMAKSENKYDTNGNSIDIPEQYDKSGFYIGMIGKVSLDGVFDLGEHASLFAGFEYQWGRLTKRIKYTANNVEQTVYLRPKFYGPGIRMGVSFLF